MKNYLIENMSDYLSLDDKTMDTFFINMLVAFAIALAVYIAYRATYTGVAYSKRFNVSLIMLTLITTMVMTVISNNLALSLGMVGALSIVRFRTAVKDPRDTAFIFWCIAIGICCGVSKFTVAAIGSAFIFLMLIVMGQVKEEGKYLLIVHCGKNKGAEVESVLFNYFGNLQLRVRNNQRDSIEFIYEVSAKTLKKAIERNEEHILDKLIDMEDVTSANLVSQTDDINR